MSDQLRKKLFLKKTSSTEEEEGASSRLKRSGKRLIRRDQLPQDSLANTKALPPNKAIRKDRKPFKAPTQSKPQMTPPSDLRVVALNKQLQVYAVWRDYQPLALGIEKSLFRFIAAQHISASKRVVQKLLKRHTSSQPYRENTLQQMLRYELDGTPAGEISQMDKDYAQRQLGIAHSA